MRCYSKFCVGRASAFTLAEMMVVLLIASIVLACMAPAITTRIKAEQNNSLTSPWRWTQNGTDAYFSTDSSQAAMIGQRLKADTDSAKLIINNSTGLDDMILFKNGDDVLGSVRFQNNGIRLGTSANAVGQGSVGIGIGTTSTNKSAVVGNDSNAGANAVVLGNGSTASDSGTVIGNASNADANAVVLGNGSTASDSGTVIGNASNADADAIVIGSSSNAFANAIVIGNNIDNTSDNSISIGQNSSAGDVGAVAIGNGARALGQDNTAIGKNACQFVTGSNKTCIGADSGPENNHAWARNTDATERIFIGSKSKFNGGPAVLEVHNSDATRDYRGGRLRNDTSVVINGNLIVKGFVFSSLWTEGGDDIVAFYGHHGDQMEYFDTSKGTNTMVGYYGSSSNGDFIDNDGESISNVTSDRRLKNVGKENFDGLAKLRKIKVFNYTFKKDETKTPRVGVIAQDLQKIFPNAVKKGADGFLTIRMEDMFYAVINAIKELDSRVTKLEKENKELRARLEKLEAKMK